MKLQVTPKQLARAIQVSESSVKRWCDLGLLPTERTAGGHRRIPVHGVLDFLRTTQQPLVRPELLGLPAAIGKTERVLDRCVEPLRAALLVGDEDHCRRLIWDLHLAGHSLALIADRVLASAFHAIGDFWACGQAEVFQERRACEICRRLLAELREALALPAAEAPVAIGGTPEGDFYFLPTSLVELALRELGWNAVSLGSGIPFASLRVAVERQRPKLVWLSVSHVADEARFLAEYAAFFAAVSPLAAVVVGGRAVSPALRAAMNYAACCDRLEQLQTLARALAANGSV